MAVLVVVNDLMFKEKIAAAGRELGAELHFARSFDHARGVLAEHPCRTAIVDLHLKNADPVGIGAGLKSEGLVERVLGYYSHVEVELAGRAEEAGFDEVMPRSAFVARMPALLGTT